jgi:hypothetical protein
MIGARRTLAEFLLPLVKVMLCMLPLRRAKRAF